MKTQNVELLKLQDQVVSYKSDVLAVESPLEIRLASTIEREIEWLVYSVVMRTPGDDEDLVRGMLWTDRIVDVDEIVSMRPMTGVPDRDVIVLKMQDGFDISRVKGKERWIDTACGWCGRSSFPDNFALESKVNGGQKLKMKSLWQAQKSMLRLQATFQQTGGLHAAALANYQGDVLLMKEDVGRHNAVDKVLGAWFLEGDFDNKMMVLSGRVSYDLVQKLALAGVKVINALGAPTSLAVQMAKNYGVSLVGFVKPNRANVYTQAWRFGGGAKT